MHQNLTASAVSAAGHDSKALKSYRLIAIATGAKIEVSIHSSQMVFIGNNISIKPHVYQFQPTCRSWHLKCQHRAIALQENVHLAQCALRDLLDSPGKLDTWYGIHIVNVCKCGSSSSCLHVLCDVCMPYLYGYVCVRGGFVSLGQLLFCGQALLHKVGA